MITILSSLDERLRPKGSRDPLGIEAIWSHVGREVVGHLTTVSNNLDNFIVALLCCHYANEQPAELEQVQTRFLQAEQVAAYLQLSAASKSGTPSFLGITRARRNFYSDKMTLGRSASAQILSEQLSYGLWGLYSSPLSGAGLIRGTTRQPSQEGLEVIGNIIEHMGQRAWSGFRDLCQQRQIKLADLEPTASRFRIALGNENLREQVVMALLNNQKGADLQTELYAKAVTYLAEASGARNAQSFNDWLRQKSSMSTPDMYATMQRMSALEPLLVVAERVMAWLQREASQPRHELTEKVSQSLTGIQCDDQWKLIPGLPHRAFLIRLHDCVNVGDGGATIDALIAQNKLVMQRRGGAAWIEFDAQQKLKVRVRNDSATLPESLKDDSKRWRNSYFLTSFLNVIAQRKAWHG